MSIALRFSEEDLATIDAALTVLEQHFGKLISLEARDIAGFQERHLPVAWPKQRFATRSAHTLQNPRRHAPGCASPGWHPCASKSDEQGSARRLR